MSCWTTFFTNCSKQLDCFNWPHNSKRDNMTQNDPIFYFMTLNTMNMCLIEECTWKYWIYFCFRLLYSVLPPSVANELRHKRPVPAKRYDNVTILFSGIVGFNAFCSKHASAEGAIKIVNLLNDIYTRFDILTDSRKNPYVYKVRGGEIQSIYICLFGSGDKTIHVCMLTIQVLRTHKHV